MAAIDPSLALYGRAVRERCMHGSLGRDWKTRASQAMQQASAFTRHANAVPGVCHSRDRCGKQCLSNQLPPPYCPPRLRPQPDTSGASRQPIGVAVPIRGQQRSTDSPETDPPLSPDYTTTMTSSIGLRSNAFFGTWQSENGTKSASITATDCVRTRFTQRQTAIRT
ncbi:MAG: hypothetical protein ACI8UD_002941 [Planctomycetota bacterium]